MLLPKRSDWIRLELLDAAQAGLEFIAEFRDADHLHGDILQVFPQAGNGLLPAGRVRGAEDDDGIGRGGAAAPDGQQGQEEKNHQK